MKSLEECLIQNLENKQYSYIAIVITKWHELGAEACFIQHGKPGGRGLLIIEPHPTAGFLLSERDVNNELFDRLSSFY